MKILHLLTTPMVALLLFCTISCNVAKQILKDADKQEQKEEQQAQAENPAETLPKTTPKPKETKRANDVPISGKLDPDGLPVSNNEAMRKLEITAFPNFFNIDNDITVRYKKLSEAQIAALKKSIKEIKADFFNTFSLEKNEANAEEDYTKGVIINIFENDAQYRDLFPKLFDTRTYSDPDLNAGMCFENNPAFKDNIARIALKIFNDENGINILNVKHEFVHYLDMRYNWASTGIEPNDWWMEGLAEYLGNPDDEKEHIRLVKKYRFTLKNIMSNDNTDNSNEAASNKKYSGGNLVVKFMFDNHINEIEAFLDIVRNAQDEDKYKKWKKAFIQKYNVAFSKWVAKLK
jgi:hypothetical protein